MKILIIKASALGDIIHAFPVIGFIKEKYPHAEIDWVVESPFSALVKAHPDVSEVIEVNTKKWRKKLFSSETFCQLKAFKRQLQQKKYDVIFDLQGNTKSGFVSWLANSPIKVGFDSKSVHEWPNLFATNMRYSVPKGITVRAEYLRLAQAHFDDFTPYAYPGVTLKLTEAENSKFVEIIQTFSSFPAPPLMVCPGSNWRNKQLSDSSLKDFLNALLQNYRCSLVFVWGTDDEKEAVNMLSNDLKPSLVLDKVSLPLLQNVMSKVALVIAMDSLALHLAATTATPTFSVFGASLAAKYKPDGERHVALQGSCPYGVQFDRRCPKLRNCSTGACIRSLKGQEILRPLRSSSLFRIVK